MASPGGVLVFIVLALLLTLLAGLASLALFGAGLYVAWAWYAGELMTAAWLVGAALAIGWSLLGRHVVLMCYRRGTDDPHHHGEGERLRGVRGCTLHVESEGHAGAQTLVLTHGWGFDASAWYYIRKHLGRRFRLVLWDLPGLGASTSFEDGVFEIERFAANLRLLVERSEGPVTLVGHSIGGMTMLTFCRLYPDLLDSRVQRLVLIDTTFTAPHRTTIGARLLPAVQKPVAKAILQLNRLLWPLVWIVNWQSYLNGSSHLITRLTSFSNDVTRGQLDFAARFTATQNPRVVAKGMLATLDWDESATLGKVPIPAAVIVGNEDRLTVPNASGHMSRTMPQATLTHITPAGHSGILEEGDAYASAIAAAATRDAEEKAKLHLV